MSRLAGILIVAAAVPLVGADVYCDDIVTCGPGGYCREGSLGGVCHNAEETPYAGLPCTCGTTTPEPTTTTPEPTTTTTPEPTTTTTGPSTMHPETCNAYCRDVTGNSASYCKSYKPVPYCQYSTTTCYPSDCTAPRTTTTTAELASTTTTRAPATTTTREPPSTSTTREPPSTSTTAPSTTSAIVYCDNPVQCGYGGYCRVNHGYGNCHSGTSPGSTCDCDSMTTTAPVTTTPAPVTTTTTAAPATTTTTAALCGDALCKDRFGYGSYCQNFGLDDKLQVCHATTLYCGC